MSANLVFVGFHGTADRSVPESQNELIAALLADSGFTVRSASAQPIQLVRLIDQVRVVVQSLRWADVIVACQFSGRRAWTNVLITRLTRRASVPTVIVLRGGALPEHAAAHPRQIDSTLSLATRVLAPSGYLQRAFEQRGHRVGIVPNYVRMSAGVDHPAVDQTRPSILWMRAFHPVYQPDLAVAAFARLVDAVPGARLTMAGPDRGLLEATRRQVAALGLTGRVTFPGYLEGAVKIDAFGAHDAFLNTTKVDNSPVSVIEAMGAGVPVVATDVGGLRDLARDGDDALLVPNGNPEALARALERVLTDPALATHLRTGGRAIAARHDAQHVRASWANVLADLGARATPAPVDGCAALSGGDLDDVVAIHLRAFPASALTALGSHAVRRYYRWQFSGPHPDPVALGCWREGHLVGFLVGGARHRAVAGFARSSPGVLATGVLSHPRVLRHLAASKVRAILGAIRAMRGDAPTGHATSTAPAAGPPRDAPVRSFGVLSIAVAEAWRGRGVADELLCEAEREARRRAFTSMNLSVNTDNERAVGFYTRHGWHQSSTSPWDGKMAKDLDLVPQV